MQGRSAEAVAVLQAIADLGVPIPEEFLGRNAS
jgi:hypothetical protein